MAKKLKTTALEKLKCTAASTKKKERDLFSVRSSSLKSRKVGKTGKLRKCDDGSDDEQVLEIKRMQKQANNAKRNQDIKNKETICYGSMVSGTVVGCCITHVLMDRIIVTLPHRMKGYIPLTHISTQYTALMHKLADGQSGYEAAHTLPELYKPGQYLTAAVASVAVNIGVSGHAGLPLSMYPSDVNGSAVSVTSLRTGCVLQCSVVSVEDHGYTVDTGVRGVSAAFLPAADVPAGQLVAVGSVLPCVVNSVRGAERAVSLVVSADPSAVAAAAGKPSHSEYSCSVPGTSVQGIVAKSAPEGLNIHVGSEESYYASLGGDGVSEGQTGVISPHHLRGPFDGCHLFRVGQKVQAKILFTTSFPRTVHLTLNKNVLNYDPPVDYDPQHGLSIGDVVHLASVLTCSSAGLAVRLSEKCLGFCSIFKVPGVNTQKKLLKKYPPGTQVSCKLIAYNIMDHMFVISLDPTHVTEEDTSSSLLPGMVISVSVVSHSEAGARVRTQGGVMGFVPSSHLTDTNVADPALLHPVGATRRARLLRIQEQKAAGAVKKLRIYFTFKTMLVKSDLPIVVDYSEGNIGLETLGVVRRIFDNRMFLEFCGGVHGLVHSNEFSREIVLSDTYHPGHVMRVKIKSLAYKGKPLYYLTLPSKSIKTIKTTSSKSNPVNFAEELTKITQHNRDNVNWLSQMKSILGTNMSSSRDGSRNEKVVKCNVTTIREKSKKLCKPKFKMSKRKSNKTSESKKVSI